MWKKLRVGFSRRDFVAKCSIAYKEARETHYWLRLLRDTECLDTTTSRITVTRMPKN
ncbi:MAG: four helix bundle protein [Hymenobacter sp.]